MWAVGAPGRKLLAEQLLRSIGCRSCSGSSSWTFKHKTAHWLAYFGVPLTMNDTASATVTILILHIVNVCKITWYMSVNSSWHWWGNHGLNRKSSCVCLPLLPNITCEVCWNLLLGNSTRRNQLSSFFFVIQHGVCHMTLLDCNGTNWSSSLITRGQYCHGNKALRSWVTLDNLILRTSPAGYFENHIRGTSSRYEDVFHGSSRHVAAQ